MVNISDPIRIRNVELKNRLYASPMITNIVREDCIAGQNYIESIYRRAKGGWGLVCTEAAIISEKTKLFPRTLGIFDDGQILGLSEISEAIHSGNAKAMIQLHHAGRQCDPSLLPKHVTQEALAPSDTTPSNPFTPGVKPRGMTEQEIWEVIDDYAKAALRAQKAGFDMVLIHGSHGFLPQQFLSPFTNHRTDKWGGDWNRRLEFIRQLLKQMRDAVGDFPICFRVAGDEFVEGGYTIEDFCRYIAPVMEDSGCDMLDVTCGTFDHFATVMPEMYEPRGVWTYLSEKVKAVVSIPVAGLSRICDGRLAARLVEKNKCDLVGIGRGSYADHAFANKTIAGKYDDIRQCIACNACVAEIFGVRPAYCAVNFACNRSNHWEEERMLPVKSPKNIMVVGGGPGGMEFARLASKRGHHVTIYEKTDRLGGCLNLASSYPRLNTRDLMNIVRWLAKEIQMAKIKVHMNTEVTHDLVNEVKPDAVVLATGSKQSLPDIPGMDGANVITLDEYFAGGKTVGKKVAVIGGHYGAEVAVSMAREGKALPKNNFEKYAVSPDKRHIPVMDNDRIKSVLLFEEGPDIAWPPYMLLTRNIALTEFLEEAGAEVYVNTQVLEIKKDEIFFAKEGTKESTKVDTVIIAISREPEKRLYRELAGKGVELHEIGDCTGPGTVQKAIHMANVLAREI